MKLEMDLEHCWVSSRRDLTRQRRGEGSLVSQLHGWLRWKVSARCTMMTW